MAIVAFEEQVEIPLNLRSLSDLRRRVGSGASPQRGGRADGPEFGLADEPGERNQTQS